MNRRLLLLLLIAIVAAGSTVLSLRGWIEGQRADYASAAQRPQADTNTDDVLVASTSLPTGLLVKRSHLRWQAWPKEAIAETYIVRGRGVEMTDFEGTVVRTGVASGEPLTNERVVKPGERGFLAAVLSPGKRAVSIPVTATTGIAGFIFPGDRVDLILTHAIDKKGDGERTRRASETVLTDVRVLAVDQETDDQNGKASIAKTVTLDRRLAVVTTANLDRRSFELNFEVSMVVYDTDFASQLRLLQKSYLDGSTPVDPAAWRRRGWPRKLLQNTAGMLGPLL